MQPGVRTNIDLSIVVVHCHTHTLMAEQDPLKTSMATMALVLGSEVALAAARSLAHALEIFRRSRKVLPPQRAAAKMRVARLGWAFVTEARKERVVRRAADSPDLRDAMKAVQGCIAFATSGAPKAKTASSVMEACKRDEVWIIII